MVKLSAMETELIDRLKAGHGRSFAELVAAHQDRVLNVCYAFLHNRQDAEDVAQEVFAEVFQSIHKFRGDAKLSTWINRIAINRSLDLLRKKKRKKRMSQFRNLLTIPETADEPAVPDAALPDQILEQKERAHILQQAVHSLPQSQAVAITMSQYQGYDNAEIAEIMGLSVSAVVSLLHRAKKNLYRRLSRYYEKNL
jgi:RNA polymerase sigma-70 factor (ECF subfamily)